MNKKELSVEEKAKSYDDAIAHAKLLLKTIGNATLGNLVLKHEFEIMFPELKESEDERIRKELVEYFKWNAQQILNDFDNKDVLVWLEKQGEHAKFRDSIQVGDKVTRNQDGVLVNLSQLKRVAKPAEEQGEQKQELLTKEKALKNSPFVEQKSAEWSEEDETVLDNLIYALANDRIDNNRDEYVDWLNSLKDRVQLQPKQEWSEEDENIIKELINDLEDILGTAYGIDKKTHGYSIEKLKEQIDWLKSLRPKSTWKPSEKQKEALLWCVVHLGGADKQTLGELLEELNKL